MARTLAQIDADIAALQAVPPGVQSVSFSDGRSTTFSTEQQKQSALARLTAERAAATAETSGTKRRRKIMFQTSKGL